MDIKVDRLREALNLLHPVVPKKSTLPVMTNVLLQGGRAVAGDLETAIAIELPEIEGQCLIPHRSVIELLKRIPGHNTLTIEQKDKSLSIAWPGGKASYDVPLPEDFPLFPKVESKVWQTIDGDALVAGLSSSVGYCASETDRLILSGVTLYLGEKLEVLAGDGFRMVYQSLPVAFAVDSIESIVIPAQSVQLLKHLWDKTPRTPTGTSIVELVTSKRLIDLAVGDNKLEGRLGRATIVIKLIEGTPPNWKQMLPEKGEERPNVMVMAPEFERAVRRVQDAASDSKIVRLSWSEVAMTLSAKGEENQIETTVPVEAPQPGKVAVNFRYLLEYLRGKEGMVLMGVKSPEVPVLFRYGTSPLVIIMPMTVEW